MAMAERYFEQAKYRIPQHPVIEAYVRPKLDEISRVVSLGKNTSLLDVGCGNGVFTYYFEQVCGFVSGLDNSRNMLAENPCPRVLQAEATDLPFRDSSFDVVFEANVLHHVQERPKVVREMARVSRRWVVLIEPNRNSPIMLAFGLLVPEERGLLTSTKMSNLALLHGNGLKPVFSTTTGMISQNNTPAALLPFLKRFDRETWYGEYVVLVAEKNMGAI